MVYRELSISALGASPPFPQLLLLLPSFLYLLLEIFAGDLTTLEPVRFSKAFGWGSPPWTHRVLHHAPADNRNCGVNYFPPEKRKWAHLACQWDYGNVFQPFAGHHPIFQLRAGADSRQKPWKAAPAPQGKASEGDTGIQWEFSQVFWYWYAGDFWHSVWLWESEEGRVGMTQKSAEKALAV